MRRTQSQAKPRLQPLKLRQGCVSSGVRLLLLYNPAKGGERKAKTNKERACCYCCQSPSTKVSWCALFHEAYPPFQHGTFRQESFRHRCFIMGTYCHMHHSVLLTFRLIDVARPERLDMGSFWHKEYLAYRIVASRSTSRLVTCLGLFRLLMKGIFDPYVL